MREQIRELLQESMEGEFYDVHLVVYNKEHYQKILAGELMNIASLAEAYYGDKQLHDDHFVINAKFLRKQDLEKFQSQISKYMGKRYSETTYDMNVNLL